MRIHVNGVQLHHQHLTCRYLPWSAENAAALGSQRFRAIKLNQFPSGLIWPPAGLPETDTEPNRLRTIIGHDDNDNVTMGHSYSFKNVHAGHASVPHLNAQTERARRPTAEMRIDRA